MRVLIISPHFPPTNAADMQRVRLILPYLAEAGVSVQVLSVEAAHVAAPLDPWLAAGLPPEIAIHRVAALGLEWSRVPGLGTLTYRALRALRRKGNELLGRNQSSSSFDLVYFSTTQFGIHVLGPEWMRKFGVPFVVDYQDPWVSNYYSDHPEVVPPGGQIKYALASWMSRRQEPRVLKHCSGITSVSAAYPEQLARRYGGEENVKHKDESRNEEETASGRSLPEIKRFQFSAFKSQLLSIVLPFPGDVLDFERGRQDGIRQNVFDSSDGFVHWVYVGRGGPDMAFALRAIFCAIRSALDFPLRPQGSEGSLLASIGSASPPDLSFQLSLSALKIHFIGTSYAAAGKGGKTIEPLAAEYGLEGMVSEHTDRIPYSETLRCLLDANALIVPGSNDPGYTASKIYPYLLAQKPLLTVFHEQSSVVDLIQKVGGAVVVPFSTGEPAAAVGERILRGWLENERYSNPVPLDKEAFEPYTARAQARQMAAFFRRCLEK